MKFAFVAAALSLALAASATPTGSAPSCSKQWVQSPVPASPATEIKITPKYGVYAGQKVGAAAQDDSYLTYKLVSDDVNGGQTALQKCEAACRATSSCKYVNLYQELKTGSSDPKQTPGKKTCSLFSKCLKLSNYNNVGGQGHEGGPYNKVTESNGYCYKKVCS